MKRGRPFAIGTLYTEGNAGAVQKAMSQLVKQGKVVRVERGIYSRPKNLKNLPTIYYIADAIEVARVWAKARNYKLVSQGAESASRLALQNQTPMKTIFWSDGPSRTFKIARQEVHVRHKSASRLKWHNKPEGELLRALNCVSPESTPITAIQIALKRLNLSNQEKSVVIEKLLKEKQLSQWKQKLSQVMLSL